jgi:hypothetical protein
VYYFPQPQRVTLRYWANGIWTSHITEVSGGGVLHNTSKRAITTNGFQTAPDLLGSAAGIEARTPRLYAPDKVTVLTTHDLQALEEMVPSEVARLDRVSSVMMSPRHLTDVNTLLHVKQASIRREQNTVRYYILTAIFGTLVTLILVKISLRPLMN